MKMTAGEGGSKKSELPFFPKYDSECLCDEKLRVVWFESEFCQSRYHYVDSPNGSNACTLIAILVATKCFYQRIQIPTPKLFNSNLIYVLGYAMLEGNEIHESLKAKGTLTDINLTVPEAIKYSGKKVAGLTEWKSMLYLQSLKTSLFENIRNNWIEWIHSNMKKNHPDLYVILIADSRSVLFIIQEETDTITLIDSHQHSCTKGALIATVQRQRMKLLCDWFCEIIAKYYRSNAQIYELSFLYFKKLPKKK